MGSLIYLDSSLMEIGPCQADIDFDVGKADASSNDFLMKGALPDGVGGVYVPGTEFGGIAEYMSMNNTDSIVTNKGYTWRGLLTQGIICPPSGSDYMTVSGDANTVLSTLLADFLGGFFTVSSETSGITISSYQFPLYCTYLEGITGMLEEYGAKLVIVADKATAGGVVVVTVSAEAVETIGDVYSEEYPVSLTYTENSMGINHLICLGSGELQERTRVDLYVDANGDIGTTQYYTGLSERTAVYDYSSAESESNLTACGKTRLQELMSSKSLALNDADVDGDIGDLVYAYMNGVSATSPIVQKVLTIKGGIWTYESKIEGVI